MVISILGHNNHTLTTIAKQQHHTLQQMKLQIQFFTDSSEITAGIRTYVWAVKQVWYSARYSLLCDCHWGNWSYCLFKSIEKCQF